MDKTTVQLTNGAALHMINEKSYSSLQSVEATLTANGHSDVALGEGFGWLSELQIARTKFSCPRPKVLQGWLCERWWSFECWINPDLGTMLLYIHAHRPNPADPRVVLQAL